MNPPGHDVSLDGLLLEGLAGPLRPHSITVQAMPVEAQRSSPDLAALTARLAQSDEAAFRQFYDLYFPRLFRYLLVLTGGNEDAAKDALQLTLLRVVRHVRVFDSEAAFWSWLAMLARSALVDEARKRRRYLRFLDGFFQRLQPAPVAADHDAETRLLASLGTHLDALPPEDRDLIERKYFDGESVREIADAVHSTEKSVESRLVRIRRRLKELVLAQLHDETDLPY
ncbi:MAG: sigma-70 family RNA polymerase sigma factor [Verrucomicrobia bacterium]|nr:sigma-70 family RNA polymerase sigma factor [Verrucomicrobiota bacterium]